MAVPVHGGRASDSSTRSDEATIPLPQLIESTRAATRARRKLAVSERQRARRARDFENAMKLIAKRIAADSVGGVRDRDTRHAARADIYRYVTATVGVLSEDHSRERNRSFGFLVWALTTTAVACGAVAICVLGV